MEFPQGRDGPVALYGSARDAVTEAGGGAPLTRRFDELKALVTPGKIIEALDTSPRLPGIETLIGDSAIVGLRGRLRPFLDDPQLAGRPLAVLLDDLVGSSIIATWVWTKWIEDRSELIAWVGDSKSMENACVGYRKGASGLASHDYFDKIDYVPALGRDDDPDAFHPLKPDREKTMRRVRRVDVWIEHGRIAIDAMFQDSGIVPGMRRSAVHEYRVCASADRASGALLAIEAFRVCCRTPNAWELRKACRR
ncbi:DUF2889 domain-containing protein [Sphingosinithalassobacter portus]|uniref:DUF2889 domain-containing protein n=1 Tax=Stakelama portus TaxID=2676234 RepID=UPI00137B4D9F|nr:DUF2889 domain-containing protein [Sphingosinithalassobacter portus]